MRCRNTILGVCIVIKEELLCLYMYPTDTTLGCGTLNGFQTRYRTRSLAGGRHLSLHNSIRRCSEH